MLSAIYHDPLATDRRSRSRELTPDQYLIEQEHARKDAYYLAHKLCKDVYLWEWQGSWFVHTNPPRQPCVTTWQRVDILGFVHKEHRKV